MKKISARLGNSRIGTKMDFYGHALENIDETAANYFDDFFSRKKDNA